MTEHRIQPTTITKPMQLLAAWLVGLLAIDGCFLLAASRFAPASAEASALVWAAIVNVPLFIGALFLLQTKFRPELQEDLYYSTYISQKTNESVFVSREEQRTAAVLGRLDKVENLLEATTARIDASRHEGLLAHVAFGINKYVADKEKLSEEILKMGINSHTWFGGETAPDDRVVSISDDLPRLTRIAALAVAAKLGFSRYNTFDRRVEQIEEDVLIGSYGAGERDIPRIAA